MVVKGGSGPGSEQESEQLKKNNCFFQLNFNRRKTNVKQVFYDRQPHPLVQRWFQMVWTQSSVEPAEQQGVSLDQFLWCEKIFYKLKHFN